MPAVTFPYYIAGLASAPNRHLEVRDKYNGGTLSAVPRVTEAALTRALEFSRAGEHGDAPDLHFLRSRASAWIRARKSEIEAILCGENGHPLEQCRAAIAAAIEGRSPELPLSRAPSGSLWGILLPRALPFDALVSLILDAVSRDGPFVLCPHPKTPLSALVLGDFLESLELPVGRFSILPLEDGERARLIDDSRVFTSELPPLAFDPRSGAALPPGPLTLVARSPWHSAWVDEAILHLAFRAALSPVDHLVLEEAAWNSGVASLVEKTKRVVCGNPYEQETEVGPVASLAEADAIEAWIGEAVGRGARILCGGKRRGVLIDATLLVVDSGFRLPPLPAAAPILGLEMARAGASLREFETRDPTKLLLLADPGLEEDARRLGLGAASRLGVEGIARLGAPESGTSPRTAGLVTGVR